MPDVGWQMSDGKCRMANVKCQMSDATRRVPFVMYHLPSAICHLPFAICHLLAGGEVVERETVGEYFQPLRVLVDHLTVCDSYCVVGVYHDVVE